MKSEITTVLHGTRCTITLRQFKALKTLFRLANDAGQTEFIWLGHPLLTSYAKYLIEYLEPQFR